MTINTPLRRVALGMAALLLSIVLLGGFSTVSTTDAAWSEQQSAAARFEAGQISAVENLTCETHSRLLLVNQVSLTWDKPTQLHDQDVVYDVTWEGNNLIGDGYGIQTVSTTEFGRYAPTILDSLLIAEVKFTIRPRIVNTGWQGLPVTTSASGLAALGLLGGFSCDE